ncbi:MAG: hypothetical protein GF344_13185 [Chitinivibrionales bacterium]|nr:hypothetical protein [Chitinivibrionales bacterium]MBD3357687.1 hypothetical protein [Chitinivibrionales bacterium]
MNTVVSRKRRWPGAGMLMWMLVVFGGHLHAQTDYAVGAGFRVGPSNGITLKASAGGVGAFEAVIHSRFSGLYLCGLYEIHQAAFRAENINFYYGIGGHVGAWDGVKRYRSPAADDAAVSVGIDGIVGLEATFRTIPFAVSLDWKPLVHVYQTTEFWVDEIGFSVRYIIKRRRTL